MYLTTLDPISRDFDRIVRRAFSGGALSRGSLNYAPAYTSLGVYYADYAKDKKRARRCFQKAVELSPSEVSAGSELLDESPSVVASVARDGDGGRVHDRECPLTRQRGPAVDGRLPPGRWRNRETHGADLPGLRRSAQPFCPVSAAGAEGPWSVSG